MTKERPDLKPYLGRRLTVIAWLWARTVKSPNPAFANVDVPLASSFVLSTKSGKQAYVEPVFENGGCRFTVKVGLPPPSAKNGTKMSRGSNFQCSVSGVPMGPNYIRSQGMSGHMGARLMAIVTEGDRERVYLSPIPAHQETATMANPTWTPEASMPDDRRWFSPPPYGMPKWADLFTDRQLVALTTFSDLVAEAQDKVLQDAVAAGVPDDGMPLRDGGDGAMGYADAVGVYLTLAVGRLSNACSSFSRWQNSGDFVAGVFSRQAIPMLWDYADINVFSTSTQNWMAQIDWVAEAVEYLPSTAHRSLAFQGDAGSFPSKTQEAFSDHILSDNLLVSTDPPYYDNVGYADLSDFFYVWLRRSAKSVFPDLFATLATPKSEELVATPYRHGSKGAAEEFFLKGMTRAMQLMEERASLCHTRHNLLCLQAV